VSQLLIALAFFSVVQSPQSLRSPPKFPVLVNKPELVKKPVTGSRNVLVLLVDFPDNHHRFSKTDFENILFRTGNQSMQDYYAEVSYQQLHLDGVAVDWRMMAHPYSYYVGDSFGLYSFYPQNAQGLVEDAVRLADPTVNFATYDNDGDGYVDGLFVVHAGVGAEATGNTSDIWSHKWQLSDPELGCPGAYQTNDGVLVDVYSMEPEELTDNEFITPGVFCHEFGHVLGLPDLYNTSDGGPGIGMFCLMAAGSWGGSPAGSRPVHPSSWCKYILGWLNPDSLEAGGATSANPAQLPACAQTPKAYRILENPGGADWQADGSGSGEYFLVENRYQTGFDQSLPGSGLLILHIDERQSGNTDPSHPLVGILQGDRDPDFLLASGDWGTAADLWQSDSLGLFNNSVPASVLYDGSPTGVAVKKISAAGPVMTADLEIGLVLLGRVYSYPNPFIKKNPSDRVVIKYEPSDTVKAQTEYPQFKITIFNIAGDVVRQLDQAGEVYPLARQAEWDMKNDQGQEVTSGLYFYLIEIREGEYNKGRLTVIR
jgi:immune inhibitor A